ncbi:MAG: alpha/beta hydrolase [Actinomycetota bacterium]|nr:alpha/beta hydrolase [Actinomycetota bacterium]
MAISAELGAESEVELPQGPVRYRERGEGQPLVFAHGLLVNGDLWRKVVPLLADGYRCVTPDLPLGSHRLPVKRDADLTPPGLADLLADFVEAVGAKQGTLVANDTAGALSQILVTRRPEAVARLVLTSCDSFENFLPPMFKPLRILGGYVPGSAVVLGQAMRLRLLQRSPAGFGLLTKGGFPPEVAESFVAPSRSSSGTRHDLAKVLRGIHKRHTLEAADKLPQWAGRGLVVWARDDKVFPLDHGRRLARLLSADLVEVEDSYSFIPEDRPERLAQAIREFAD